MKLSKEQIQEMKALHESGKTYAEMGKQFNISPSTINYHVNPKVKIRCIKSATNRFHNLSKEEKHKIYLRKVPYQREYYRRRYHSDEEFRKKMIRRNVEYQRRRRKANEQKKN